ncbi:ABC transporter substrate-binding protein [Arthrobacter cryoconiti]|uniref:ABC transporter substrate-binding protein n=1 Tax=Arthrobacter cryoconiti TaxID=748907 RepID=A0ABV8R0X3_9MICC|nr:ABC transporter substrate-binding protein [Arthrobacter cryoconiti]MCC9067635.1 ABC transporter substrate-binding protein [Arthrobacter cryoconiti]
MKRNHLYLPLVLFAASSLALSGCAPGATSQSGGDGAGGTPAAGGDLVITQAAGATSLNLTTVHDNPSIFTAQQIMEPLFTVSNDGKDAKPWLAKSYEVSADQLSYTIKLRDDVHFSSGAPMTAADVKFSIDQDTKTASSGGWGYINAAIKDVAVVDDTTIKVTANYPWTPLIADLAMFSNAIVPNNYGGKTADEFYQAPVGTGPFVFDTWKKGQTLTFAKNKNYWQAGKPYLDSVTWNVVPDVNTRKLQLQGSQADIVEAPDWSSFDSLGKTPGIATKAFESTAIDHVAFNQLRKPFADVHVRRAIAYAIDRQALVDAVLFGHGTPANSLLSPGTPYYDKDVKGPSLDLDKAKAEMAKSSVPKGFSTKLLISSGNTEKASNAQIIQSELKEIGIDVEITPLDPTAGRAAINAGDYDMTLTGWTMDIPDPDQWTTFAVDPAGGAKSDYTSYENPDVIKLNRDAQRETDPKVRADLYKQLQQKTGDDAFLAYLYYSPYGYAMRDTVKDFLVTPLGNYHLEDVYKTK